jgi:hypothetical protein
MPRASTARLVWAALLLAATAHAEPAAPVLAPIAESQLRYAGYVAGLQVFALNVNAAIVADRYRIHTVYHTNGLLSAFVSGELHTRAVGVWRAGYAVPEHYQAWGTWRGDVRETLIDYFTGKPAIRTLIPPIAGEREPVPEADQADTIDTLSGFAALTNLVNATGRCDVTARLFDGRRLSVAKVVTMGEEVLAPEPRSPFAGRALRCDLTSTQIGGFTFEKPRDPAASQNTGTLWFARPTPGAQMAPIRMSFHLHLFGLATMYLTAAQP